MVPVVNNDLLLKAASIYGTPLYVYDKSCIQFQFKKVQSTFERNNAKIFYACKALTNINILRVFTSANKTNKAQQKDKIYVKKIHFHASIKLNLLL